MIPLEAMAKKPIMIAGGMSAVDTLYVTHRTDGEIDGISELSFKTFEQRREKLQSETLDLIWVDEKPSEEVYSELLARTSATDGHLIVSYTPVGAGGAAGLTYRFLSEASTDRSTHRITGAEAKHISAERREELGAGYSEAERETRLEGTPQLGTGPVFPLELLPSLIKSFDQDHLPLTTRWCVGIDFGYDHPFAAVLIAWDPMSGQIWVVDSFRMERSSALYHVQRIINMCRGLLIPIAYPHDGGTHDKGSGLSLKLQYENFGANMMAKHALNHNTTNYNVEAALSEIRDMFYAGNLIIAPHNYELIDELRNYHRDDGLKIVKQRDDLISAMRYAINDAPIGQGQTALRRRSWYAVQVPFCTPKPHRRPPAIRHRLTLSSRRRHGSFYGPMRLACARTRPNARPACSACRVGVVSSRADMSTATAHCK